MCVPVRLHMVISCWNPNIVVLVEHITLSTDCSCVPCRYALCAPCFHAGDNDRIWEQVAFTIIAHVTDSRQSNNELCDVPLLTSMRWLQTPMAWRMDMMEAARSQPDNQNLVTELMLTPAPNKSRTGAPY